ncbi:MAG TPA: hypothetical protein VFB84_16775 [Micromonosporaceae bacterium]|nr:hypothetical protein [Micromonosporaceae bacterium]
MVEHLFASRAAGPVFATLIDWATGENVHQHLHAARAFIRLTSHVDQGAWPNLLAMADGDRAHYCDVARLWRLALCEPTTAFDAWEMLGLWVGSTAGEPGLTDAMADLLSQVFIHPSLRLRGRFHLDRMWKTHLDGNPFRERLAELLKEQ